MSKNNTASHIVRNTSDDPKKPHYVCQQERCPFETDDLTDVAKHAVENQFSVVPENN